MEPILTVGSRVEYQSPYEEFADRNGSQVVVTRVVTEPDENYDAEVLPMYEVKFDFDGFRAAVFPEEVEP